MFIVFSPGEQDAAGGPAGTPGRPLNEYLFDFAGCALKFQSVEYAV